MKVTQVAICPAEASRLAGRPALTPELLAASGARYSRNNEGLDEILSRIDPANLEKSVDSIFRMVDYGHQSIADMVPVAMFIDGVSLWLAYYVWTLCPTAGGQESSTRYIRIAQDALIDAEHLGIPDHARPAWQTAMAGCTEAYQNAVAIWEDLARENPRLMGIPRSLLEDPSENAKKKVARMRRNYAFDRARYLLPVSASTNLMLVMSARGWVNLCQFLLSHPLPEPQALGTRVRGELEICAPRMLKHARCLEVNSSAIAQEFQHLVQLAGTMDRLASQPLGGVAEAARPSLTAMLPEGVSTQALALALKQHTNRYAPFGMPLQRTAVRFSWPAMTFAEIRDLNRHRTGTKYCPQVPCGFYFAMDQMPEGSGSRGDLLLKTGETGHRTTAQSLAWLQKAEPSYIYWSLLGTEFPFEHTTTADKFIYEAELRTGLGAHFRYARHFRDVLALWYEQFPETRGLILEGDAEPE